MVQLLFTGSYDYFMQKEIYEQPESVVNTMRGRVNFGTEKGEFILSVYTMCIMSIVCASQNSVLTSLHLEIIITF